MAQRVSKDEYAGEFSNDLVRVDHLLCMYMRSGYHHFLLHPKMRNWFVIRNRDLYSGVLLSLAVEAGAFGGFAASSNLWTRRVETWAA